MSQRSLYELWLREPLEVIGVHALANAYAYDVGTDGVVPRGVLRSAGASDEAIAATIQRGLLEEDGGVLRVSAYLAHNPSAAKVEAKREKERQKKRGQRNAVPAGQLGVDHATLHAVDRATLSPGDIRLCPQGTSGLVPRGHSALSPGDIAPASPTRVGALARQASPLENQEAEETEVVGPPPGGVGGTDRDHVRLQEAIDILVACPRLAVDVEAIAVVLADDPAADWRAAAAAVVDWSAGPNVRRLPVNAASTLRTVLTNGTYAAPAPRSRWDIEAAASAAAGPVLVEVCEDPTSPALDAWLAIRRDVRGRVPDHTFDLWFAGVHAHDLRDTQLVVGAPLQVVSRLEQRFSKVLLNAAATSGLAGVLVEACADHRRLEVAS